MRVAIEPTVLVWAQEASGRADEVSSHFPHWTSWTDGTLKPTLKQVEDIAHFTHLPFGVFFLSSPPELTLPLPDYRNGPSAARAAPSPDLLAVLQSSIARQDWYQDYLERQGLGPARFPTFTVETPVAVAADEALKILDYTVERRRRMTREAARNHLRYAFEELGGLVVFTSMVGNDTHRLLSREEFRGFTFASTKAPFIFVNSHNDTLAGQIFTFLHEFAHVLLGRTGISDEDPTTDSNELVEHWCNAFAAESLVPRTDLWSAFSGKLDLPGLDRLANRYLCSTLVVLLQLRRTGLLPVQGFRDLYSAEVERSARLAELQPDRDGGNFYLNQPFRIGERLSRAVLSDVQAGATSYTDAFRILGLRNPHQLTAYARSLRGDRAPS